MARTKEFDRDEALDAAVSVFRQHGFEGASTEALLAAMGISRQSMYDTFGDKKRLYVAALHRYAAGSVTETIRVMCAAATPLGGLEAALLAFANRSAKERALGCLGVGAVCEFGRSDPAVTTETEASQRRLLAAFERQLTDARELGEIGPGVDVSEAAHFLAATLTGLKVGARGGASAESLRATARLALRALR